MTDLRRAAGLLLLAAVLTACPGGTLFPPPPSFTVPFGYSQYVVAQKATSTLHVRYDQRNYDAIYAMTDDTFRAGTTKDQFAETLTRLRERLGMSRGSRERSHETTPIGLGPDVLVTLEMDSTFEGGAAVELVIWRVTASNVTYLMRYDVR